MTTVATMMTTMTARTVMAATATAARFTGTMMAINITKMFAVRFGNTTWKKKNRIHNKAERVHINTVYTATVICEEGTVNRLSNHDGDGVENVSLTVHSRSLKLHCDYSKSITLSHTQDNYNSLRWILRDQVEWKLRFRVFNTSSKKRHNRTITS